MVPLSFQELQYYEQDRHLLAFNAFRASCRRIADGRPVLRPAADPEADLRTVSLSALSSAVETDGQARSWFEAFFRPYRVRPRHSKAAFLTGYYEPEVEGSLKPSSAYSAPVLARPVDLVNQPIRVSGETLMAARRAPDGTLAPYPTRAEIQADRTAYSPVIWLRDAIEVFMVQVQGSARVKLPDGRVLRLVYAGRNGRPYTSIGRILVQEGHVPLAELTLDRLKEWVRGAGQATGEAGRLLMERNESYVFFEARPCVDAAVGPIGGEGVNLTTGRSLAIDRTIWPYGLPVWISGAFADEEGRSGFHRLMTAQDTGSAILGPGRGDIFFGSGETAGRRAAMVRHSADFVVFLPKGAGCST